MGGLLLEAAGRHAGREAICFYEADGTVVRWTYADLVARARQFAKALVAAGAGKGTRVALLMGNRPEWVSAAFGVGLAGGVLVPVNTMFEPPELEYVLRHSDAADLVYQERLGHHRYHEQIRALHGSLPYLARLACFGTAGYEDFVAAAATVDDDVLEGRAAEVSEHDDALVIYTSGTTGKPKGVLHAHRAACIQSWRFARHLGLDSTARVWSAFPFFWTAGFCMVMGATLAAGGCLVLQELFEPGEALALLEAERVTTPHAWTHQLAALESHPDWARRDLSSLRNVDIVSSFSRHPSVTIAGTWSPRAAYGLTETFTIISSMPADTPEAEREGHEGFVLPGNAVRIVEASSGVAQPAGVPGEIRVKGPTLMKGYQKVATEDVFDADGFFPTGDAGFVDDDGHLHWVGRTSDLIKTGGANVSPVEIENELLRHPGLHSALAVGVPHPTLGQIVVVCAVAQPGTALDEDGVRDFLRGKLASYKLPRRVLFFDEDELVLTGNAKIRADDLRRLAAARLAHSENAF
jgi:fatty-acyl-CoA synthase